MKRFRITRLSLAALALFAGLLAAACTPLYTSDTYIQSTPRSQTMVDNLAAKPVAALAIITPASLQGFGPCLSQALLSAFKRTQPPIRLIPTYEIAGMINEEGLAGEYADLISGFAPGGILEGQRLRRIGSAVGSRYLLLPGLAEFSQLIMDKYEAIGIKLVRTRVTTLRLWIQLWDSQTGRILWEANGELTATTALLNAKRTVALDVLAQKLWSQMIEEDLLGGKTATRIFLRD